MLSLEEFKKHLPDKNMSDEEVTKLRDEMDSWASLIFEVWMEDRKRSKRYKVGEVLQVIAPKICKEFLAMPNAAKVQITVACEDFYEYNILTKDNEILGQCKCFKDSDLLPYEHEQK